MPGTYLRPVSGFLLKGFNTLASFYKERRMKKIEREIKWAMKRVKKFKNIIKLAMQFEPEIGDMSCSIYDSHFVLKPAWKDLSKARKHRSG